MHRVALWWIKRDIRLLDNLSLSWCQENAGAILPVYVIEPDFLAAPDNGSAHLTMIATALNALRPELRARGGDLLILRGPLPHVFEELRKSLSFSAIASEQETGLRWSLRRDAAVRAWCRDQGIELHETPRNGVIRGLPDREERISLWRTQLAGMPLPAPAHIPFASEAISRAAESFVDLGTPRLGLQTCTEAAAHNTLDSFLESRAGRYKAGLSGMNTAASACSRLSVHLAWGTLSLRTVLRRTEERRAQLHALTATERKAQAPGVLAGLSAFSSRLHWHDHFIQRLECETEMEFHALNRAFDELEFEDSAELLDRWLTGTTGFPYPDAAMRCLSKTGWLNFRSRAMLVSLAVHALHLSWKSILYPMAALMADYLPGIHVSQTQMQTGVTGINTVRIYSPSKQLDDHDPECTFVKTWIPELRDASPAEITNGTWKGPYPHPAVDHRERSAVMRSRIQAIRRSSFGRAESERVLIIHGSRKQIRRQ